jgi:hypothetical protein
MSLFKIVTSDGIQKVLKEDDTEVGWLDEEYRDWLNQGNMPDIIADDNL